MPIPVIVAGAKTGIDIAKNVVNAIGSIFGGKDNSIPGLNDYIRSVNTPDGKMTDFMHGQVMDINGTLAWMKAHSDSIGWLPVTNPESYLKPPTVPMYLFNDGTLSMSPDMHVPFTGVAQTTVGGKVAVDIIHEQLGGIFEDNARKSLGTLVQANLALYSNNIDVSGQPNVQASFASAFGNSKFLILGAVVVFGAILLMRKGAK